MAILKRRVKRRVKRRGVGGWERGLERGTGEVGGRHREVGGRSGEGHRGRSGEGQRDIWRRAQREVWEGVEGRWEGGQSCKYRVGKELTLHIVQWKPRTRYYRGK
jgi:hypothetical protein